MRAKWKVRVISPYLYRCFFLKRPSSPISGFRFADSVGQLIHKAALLNSKQVAQLNFNWVKFIAARFNNKRKFFVKLTDVILPAYKDKKFWIWTGKRPIPVITDFGKFGTKFGAYCYTKKFSPIHRGTKFVFKDIRSNKFHLRLSRGNKRFSRKKFKDGKFLKRNKFVVKSSGNKRSGSKKSLLQKKFKNKKRR